MVAVQKTLKKGFYSKYNMARVIGFNLKKISIERKEEIKGKIRIESRLDITGIKEEKTPLDKGNTVLRFDFDFFINYEPDLANLKFGGFVLLLEESKAAKKLLKEWKKEKKIEADIKERVFNTVLVKCSIKALALEEELSLPPHLPFPRVKSEKKETLPSYSG